MINLIDSQNELIKTAEGSRKIMIKQIKIGQKTRLSGRNH